MIFWSIFLIIFFIVQSFKNEILLKILDIQKYNIVPHWFSSKIWIFAIFFKKVSFDSFTHFSSKIHPKFSKNRLFHIPQYIIYLWSEFYARSNNQTIRIFGIKIEKPMSVFWFFGPFFDYFLLLSKVSKMKFYRKSLIYKNTTLYDIDFPRKFGFLRFFLRKFLLTVLLIFHRKYTPNFQKIDFSIYPNILYIYDQNFMLVPTIKLLEFSDKNWETYERLLIFWSIFWLFFLLSKVSKMKFYRKSLIYKNTTLYDIDFPRKIGFLRFFFKKVSIDGFTHFSSKIHPKFSKNRLFHIPQYIIYLWSEFYARSNNQTIRIFG